MGGVIHMPVQPAIAAPTQAALEARARLMAGTLTHADAEELMRSRATGDYELGLRVRQALDREAARHRPVAVADSWRSGIGEPERGDGAMAVIGMGICGLSGMLVGFLLGLLL